MIESQVVEVSFITDTSNTWCIDSGATNHICNTLQGFRLPGSAVMGKLS